MKLTYVRVPSLKSCSSLRKNVSIRLLTSNRHKMSSAFFRKSFLWTLYSIVTSNVENPWISVYISLSVLVTYELPLFSFWYETQRFAVMQLLNWNIFGYSQELNTKTFSKNAKFPFFIKLRHNKSCGSCFGKINLKVGKVGSRITFKFRYIFLITNSSFIPCKLCCGRNFLFVLPARMCHEFVSVE